jgi:hypothetical protein
VAVYTLMDAESFNMLGSFGSPQDALLAVAQTARRYGPTSNEALSMVLFREDVPPEEGFIAEGAELIQRALALTELAETALGDTRRGRSGRGSPPATPTSSRRKRR